MSPIGKVIHYAGRVQGVGFRYAASELASGFAVAGSVRNLPNGEVELIAEGETGQVDAFVAAVASRMARYITDTRVEERPPAGLNGFHIRH